MSLAPYPIIMVHQPQTVSCWHLLLKTTKVPSIPKAQHKTVELHSGSIIAHVRGAQLPIKNPKYLQVVYCVFLQRNIESQYASICIKGHCVLLLTLLCGFSFAQPLEDRRPVLRQIHEIRFPGTGCPYGFAAYKAAIITHIETMIHRIISN